MNLNFVLFLFFLIFVMSTVSAVGMVGGFGTVYPATSDEQSILDSVRKSVEMQLDRHFEKFEAISYSSQVVAGTNYIMVVNTGDEYLHVKIGKPLPYKNEAPFLMSVRRGVTLQTPIDPGLM